MTRWCWSLPTKQTEDQTRVVVQLRFDGVDDTRIEWSMPNDLPGTVNYFIGNDPARWLTDLPTYAGIVYRAALSGH